MSTSIGLLLLRAAFGAVLIGHGTQKLFGWFGGHGLSRTGGWFESVGYRPGRRLAALAGLAETIGGLLMVLGLVTPLAAALLIAVMLAASAVHAPHGLWTADGGFELPAFYGLTAAALAITGPGRYSLDHVLGLTWNWREALAALAVGISAAALTIGLRSRQLRHYAGPAGGQHQETEQQPRVAA